MQQTTEVVIRKLLAPTHTGVSDVSVDLDTPDLDLAVQVVICMQLIHETVASV